jgi:CheY-like chemotaxis protein
VRKVLAVEPFQIFVCNDGKVALDTVLEVRPQVLLLDVALPTMFGFEVCERVRQNPELSGTRIVLIASIYDKTRYKRSPNSLYGADDYIEKHHIPDALVPMIYRLASGSPAATRDASANELAAQEEVRSEIREAEERETVEAPAAAACAPLPEVTAPLASSVPAEDPAVKSAAAAACAAAAPAELPEPERKAKRLARIIVSDIVLNNQGKVEQGVREGNFFDLLADDIREGERLYQQRVPEPVRASTSFLNDAFEELIAKKRAELRL